LKVFGRILVWASFGLLGPIAPIVIAALVVGAIKGNVSIADVAGRGELALASVGVLGSAIVQCTRHRDDPHSSSKQTLFNLSIFSLLIVAGFYGVQTIPNADFHHDIVADISVGLLGLSGTMGILLVSAEGTEE
jgi:hypothetical protein